MGMFEALTAALKFTGSWLGKRIGRSEGTAQPKSVNERSVFVSPAGVDPASQSVDKVYAARLVWVGELQRLSKLARADGRLAVAKELKAASEVAYASRHLPDDPGTFTRVHLPLFLAAQDAAQASAEDRAAVAATSGSSIDHALAMLFLRLGPPPEPTELDYTSAGNGGGGAQQ
ncbi:hypothetical protein [Streptomyces sp. DH12]|uniref:hypothetical protein n=1 Tax=Streptomyces sp. DH12 TaxID=2857010 RepID=UPI001E4F1011|nr:hypothetical protein [Streptomyces sp. DH12]